MPSDWETTARQKREAALAAIPRDWVLQAVPSPEDQRDVTGPYIQQFLSPREIEVTETDAVGLAASIAAGTWTAVEVTLAFCHRAAIAHQLVSRTPTADTAVSDEKR